MSKLSTSEIQHIAELAKIHISDDESKKLSHKLKDILDLVEKMQSVDTDKVEPLAHAIAQNQKLREDTNEAHSNRDRYQTSSSKTDAGFYIVPKVIE